MRVNGYANTINLTFSFITNNTINKTFSFITNNKKKYRIEQLHNNNYDDNINIIGSIS